MSATEEQGMVVRESSGAAIVKAVPIPAQLQELGVRIAEEEDTGLRVIVLPPALRERVNLLTPVSSWSQADPNWTPAISLVQLDEASHTYPLPGGKKGLNKQALETLGRVAGVLYTRTARVAKDELQEGELWAYRATVGFRRSDGTVDEVTRERGFNREAEQMEIEDSVRSKPQVYDTEAKVAAEIRKRWIAELRFGPAKTESKAINRALRAGLQMPASVAAKDLVKPFLVVGFNFTPDYSDPEVKRALVSVALNAEQAIYGGRERSEQMPEIEAGDIPATPSAHSADGEQGEAEVAAEPEPSSGDADEQGGGQATEPAAVSSEPEPDLDGPKLKAPAAAINAAGELKARGDKTVAEVVTAAAQGDKRSRDWLGWAMRNLSEGEGDERLASIKLFASEQTPDLWAELQAEVF